MQAVIAIPLSNALIGKQRAAELLTRTVAGIPLLKRIILTAKRAGATDILLVCREAPGQALPESLRQEFSSSESGIRIIQFSKFNPADSSSWVNIAPQLDPQFLW